MKEGAGEDPFATDDDEAGTDPAASGRAGPGDPADDERAADVDDGATDQHDSAATDGHDGATTGGRDSTGATAGAAHGAGAATGGQLTIPYKFRRDGVQEGRDRVPLFLQPETKAAEREALREFEDRFDDDVSLTDLREAVVKAGLEDLDAVESYLEAWGYGMTFDE